MVEDKIVPFTRNSGSPRLSATVARKLGDTCRKLTLSHIKELLQNMFDTADDTLYKLAETSGNGMDQGLYFDSMRIIRFQREAIEEALFNQISDVFRDFWISTPHEESGEFTFSDELSLVNEQELEEELAIKNLIRKIRSRYPQEISAIEKRLSEIVTNKTINADNNPVGPETICKSFHLASQVLNADIKIKLILFKLFDFHLIENIGSLYQEINDIFIEAGVLPQLKLTINKNKSSTQVQSHTNLMPDATTPSSTPNSISSGGSILLEFQHLLRQPVTASGTNSTPHNTASLQTSQGIGHTSILASEGLVSSLTPLQNQIPSTVENYSVEEMNQHIKQSIRDNHPLQQLSPVDSDIIDLVSMLFDFVLEDQHIPIAARGAIARLQIPIIKAAILDKEFFSINGHPARKLLNTLAHAGLDLPPEQDASEHPALAAIKNSVDRILREFSTDIEIFTIVLDEFSAQMEVIALKNNKLVQASLKPFYEKEEQCLAEEWVIETIHSQTADKALPEPFTSLLFGPWKNVMINTYLNDGQQSTRWKNQQRFIDILCWSIEPKFITQDRKKLGNILRFLINTLSAGLEQINTPPDTISKITQALEPYHHASLHGKAYAEDDSVNGVFQVENKEDSLGASIVQLQAAILNMPDIESDETNENGINKQLTEHIVLEGFEDNEDNEDFPDDEYLELARHLEAGKWVEFVNENQKTTRARLAWKSDLLGEFTFLNWKFDVIADKKLSELASDFRAGKAKVIDDLPLIDRAFSAIMNTLQGRSANS